MTFHKPTPRGLKRLVGFRWERGRESVPPHLRVSLDLIDKTCQFNQGFYDKRAIEVRLRVSLNDIMVKRGKALISVGIL